MEVYRPGMIADCSEAGTEEYWLEMIRYRVQAGTGDPRTTGNLTVINQRNMGLELSKTLLGTTQRTSI